MGAFRARRRLRPWGQRVRVYKIHGYDYIRLFMNEDWTGGAVIQWKPENGLPRETEIPGFVLKAIVRVEGRTLLEEGLNRFLDNLEEPVS